MEFEAMRVALAVVFTIGLVLSIAGIGAKGCERISDWRQLRKVNRREAHRADWLYQFEQRQKVHEHDA